MKLPNRLQRMVGRDDAITAVSDKLVTSRFVTIAGPGGVGKTAVAVAIAHDLLETFSDAAHFVDLAALSDPDLVITSILLMLGLPAQTDDPLPALLAHLRDKRMLLILDNCEHVIASAAPLAADIFKRRRMSISSRPAAKPCASRASKSIDWLHSPFRPTAPR